MHWHEFCKYTHNIGKWTTKWWQWVSECIEWIDAPIHVTEYERRRHRNRPGKKINRKIKLLIKKIVWNLLVQLLLYIKADTDNRPDSRAHWDHWLLKNEPWNGAVWHFFYVSCSFWLCSAFFSRHHHFVWFLFYCVKWSLFHSEFEQSAS